MLNNLVAFLALQQIGSGGPVAHQHTHTNHHVSHHRRSENHKEYQAANSTAEFRHRLLSHTLDAAEDGVQNENYQFSSGENLAWCSGFKDRMRDKAFHECASTTNKILKDDPVIPDNLSAFKTFQHANKLGVAHLMNSISHNGKIGTNTHAPKYVIKPGDTLIIYDDPPAVKPSQSITAPQTNKNNNDTKKVILTKPASQQDDIHQHVNKPEQHGHVTTIIHVDYMTGRLFCIGGNVTADNGTSKVYAEIYDINHPPTGRHFQAILDEGRAYEIACEQKLRAPKHDKANLLSIKLTPKIIHQFKEVAERKLALHNYKPPFSDIEITCNILQIPKNNKTLKPAGDHTKALQEDRNNIQSIKPRMR